MDEMIKIKNLTKDFGEGRGIFDVDLNIKKGEVFGLVGINGSGKTTIMRHLMGFLHPDKGNTSIMDKDCWKKAAELKKYVGYIPGEISFPDTHSGMDFLKLQADYMGLKSMAYAEELIDHLNLDATAKLKRMSKGMKQKIAIVNAFMYNSDILLLDEATTGLDPLMQKSFTEIIKNEKKKGKTIFMSSHMFDEMENSCDRVAFLKNGKIIHVVDMETIRGNEKLKEYKIEFNNKDDYNKFSKQPFNITRRQDEYNQVNIHIWDKDINKLFNVLSMLDVRFISHQPYTLEKCFKEIYNNTEVA
ncbi:ATP-binding cassette domain-containing protein [Desemzia sp. RIT804]|uniref:ABC transporter ATP-binding protein n=1 Tax=Desemzia sp. RIT 804 TaxID=2810209 RepID=UPI00195166D2|nr:ATP-binding cassette domain-containing protein [Desemzia sp. RIT 804]MBM6615030.1 ATP-binding cassette domain-containing protein [Desemzia sp. RIT 804]